jgi:hypothetical protein
MGKRQLCKNGINHMPSTLRNQFSSLIRAQLLNDLHNCEPVILDEASLGKALFIREIVKIVAQSMPRHY